MSEEELLELIEGLENRKGQRQSEEQTDGPTDEPDGELGASTDAPSVNEAKPSYSKKSGSYGGGLTITLADNQTLEQVIANNSANGKQIFSTKDTSNFSKFDYVAQIAATGQYSAEDLFRNAEALASEGVVQFSATSHEDYWPQKFQDILDNTSDVNYDTVAQDLQNDVQFLEEEFSKTYDQMTEWAGQASGAVKDAIQTILEKFECTMSNITGVVGPACKQVETFKENLKKLKEGKEKLCGEDGKGGLDKELEDLTKDLEDKEKAYNDLLFSEPDYYEMETVTNEDGSTSTRSTGRESSAHSTWRQSLADAETARDEAKQKKEEKEEEIKALEEELDALLEEVLKTYFLIQNLVTTVKSFSEYFAGGSNAGLIASPEAIAQNKDQIIMNFENFESMPTITSLMGHYDEQGNFVDYKIGDLVNLGGDQTYKITALDPKTLSMTIVGVGDSPNQPIIETDARQLAWLSYVPKPVEKPAPAGTPEGGQQPPGGGQQQQPPGGGQQQPPTGQPTGDPTVGTPTPPSQPTPPGEPTPPSAPTGPSGPSEPTPPSPPTAPPTPTAPTAPTGPSGPSAPQPPTAPPTPTAPTAPTGPSGPSAPQPPSPPPTPTAPTAPTGPSGPSAPQPPSPPPTPSAPTGPSDPNVGTGPNGEQPPSPPSPPSAPTGPDDPNAGNVGPNGELPPSPPSRPTAPSAPSAPTGPNDPNAGQYGPNGERPPSPPSAPTGPSGEQPPEQPTPPSGKGKALAIVGALGAAALIGGTAAVVHNNKKNEEDEENYGYDYGYSSGGDYTSMDQYLKDTADGDMSNYG